MTEPERFLGKYRGSVLNNLDPMNMGRIQVQVADVSGLSPTSWAMPNVPLAGTQMGAYMVPPVGAGVWVEFEQGDPDRPIWTGCWWGTTAEVPADAQSGLPGSPSIVLQTTGRNAIVISDAPGPTGGIMLRSATGAMILVNDAGITITNGQGAAVTLKGPTVDINNGAVSIT